MKKISGFCVILSLFVLAGCACVTQKKIAGTSGLKMLTEEYPPVTFMKNGKVTGFVTDVVREVIARQGIPDTIRLTSWDEAYKTAVSEPNVVLFSTERTEKREKLFQWVGPVGKNSAILYAKRGSTLNYD
ncbi:MAG: transporter substrate-binding domain-containing protein [Syntrophales bacterium LBB04]|nr:transporter substrate-binding domain-containing protein [Syntrophales bacterium LBB04]